MIPPRFQPPFITRKPRRAAALRPAAPLVLQSAAFLTNDGTRIVLSFDRAVDPSGGVGSAFTVSDGVSRALWAGAYVLPEGPNAAQVLLSSVGSYSGAGRALIVGEGNGIVAVDDGGVWEGTSGLVLPYPYVPPAGLTLAAANYDAGDGSFTLTFDRPIAVPGMDPAQVTIGDPATGTLYAGSGTPTLLGPAQVQCGLAAAGAYAGEATALNATAATGILAEDDGGTWEGASELGLPWP